MLRDMKSARSYTATFSECRPRRLRAPATKINYQIILIILRFASADFLPFAPSAVPCTGRPVASRSRLASAPCRSMARCGLLSSASSADTDTSTILSTNARIAFRASSMPSASARPRIKLVAPIPIALRHAGMEADRSWRRVCRELTLQILPPRVQRDHPVLVLPRRHAGDDHIDQLLVIARDLA